MCQDLLSLDVVAWAFSTVLMVKMEGYNEGSLRLLSARPGSNPGNLDTPIPLDPCHLFESGEIIIDRVLGIYTRVFVKGLDFSDTCQKPHKLACGMNGIL